MSRINPITLTSAAAGVTTAAIVGATALTLGAAAVAISAIRALRSKKLAPDAVVVVTGGSRGLGLAIASRFARTPIRLVLAARNFAELQQAQATLLAAHPHLRPQNFYLVAADLSKPEEAQRLISETIAHFGRIDVLVNNAGIIDVGPIEFQTLDIFERTMQVNFFATLYTTWAALPHMRSQTLSNSTPAVRVGPSIVNIASIGGKIAVPHMLPYSASKFALVGFSQGLHAELRHKGIRVTTVCPGLMRTGGEAHANFHGNVDAERRWFNLAAKTPGIAVSTNYAADRIFRAVEFGRAEITISPQAWLAARFASLSPGTIQFKASLINQYLLPNPSTE